MFKHRDDGVMLLRVSSPPSSPPSSRSCPLPLPPLFSSPSSSVSSFLSAGVDDDEGGVKVSELDRVFTLLDRRVEVGGGGAG